MIHYFGAISPFQCYWKGKEALGQCRAYWCHFCDITASCTKCSKITFVNKEMCLLVKYLLTSRIDLDVTCAVSHLMMAVCAGRLQSCWFPGRSRPALVKNGISLRQNPGDWTKDTENLYERTDNRGCLCTFRSHAHIPFLCSITCLWLVPISKGGKWRGFSENRHHPLFAFLAWRIHIYPHCLQKTAKPLQRHDYSQNTR